MVFLWLFLLLLGLWTYAMIKRNAGSITRTPVWLLWLVMMLPALVVATWIIGSGSQSVPPLGLLLALFVLCPVVYWLLVLWGRPAGLPPAGSPGASLALEQPGKLPKPPLRPIDKDEESVLKTCFPWSVYYLQNIEYRPQAMICRGQLRTAPNLAYETVRDNVQKHFGDRFLVIFQEGLQGKPIFTLVPNPQQHPPANRSATALSRPGLALGLLLATLLTTTGVGSYLAGLAGAQIQSQPMVFWQGLPYSLALLLILGCHEMGHYLAARYYRMGTTLPYFIPVPFFLGTFGAFIQMRSPVPHRRALFDVGIAGPLAGLVVTLPLLWWGLGHSTLVPMPEKGAGLLNFQALNPRDSIFLSLIAKLVFADSLGVDQAIHLHLVGIAGCLGLLVTALNLMPVGQLDGGHIVHAMYGQRMATVVGQISRLLLLVLVLVHGEFLIWAILLFFMPAVDEPALNDISELDNRRNGLGLLALSLLVMIILPLPSVLIPLLF
ncbi:MAG: site-2 protease family protein [Cyanobacteria bacterium REEB459]|nr:site-2 protease family protein [Cyanobacteria bacterium REEB459]